jgi:hypothetical protein
MHQDSDANENADAKLSEPVGAEKPINPQGPQVTESPQNQGLQHPGD